MRAWEEQYDKFDIRWSDLDDELSGEKCGISNRSLFAMSMSYWIPEESDSEDED